MHILRGSTYGLALSFLFMTQATAQGFDNPINHPALGEVVPLGKTYSIVWTPTHGDLISIELWNDFPLGEYFNGSNCVFDDDDPNCSQIASNVPNNGQFDWKVPSNSPPSDTYYLDIFVPDPDINGPYYYMTGNFSISKDAAKTSPNSGSGSTQSGIPFSQ
jgi:hypothetical protein